MTPLDAAKAAFVDEFRRPWDATVGAADCNARSIEAACLAYVRALPEDEATVGSMVREKCFVMEQLQRNANEFEPQCGCKSADECEASKFPTDCAGMKAALKVLATKEPT